MTGRTNRNRVQNGLAPIGNDNRSINLHHIVQREDSSLVGVTASVHQNIIVYYTKEKVRV